MRLKGTRWKKNNCYTEASMDVDVELPKATQYSSDLLLLAGILKHKRCPADRQHHPGFIEESSLALKSISARTVGDWKFKGEG